MSVKDVLARVTFQGELCVLELVFLRATGYLPFDERTYLLLDHA